MSTRILGTMEILLLNHTVWGFTTFTDAELNAKLAVSTGDSFPAPRRFFCYRDPVENTREELKRRESSRSRYILSMTEEISLPYESTASAAATTAGMIASTRSTTMGCIRWPL